MFVAVMTLKYALLVSQRPNGHFLTLTDSILFVLHYKSSRLNSTHYIVLYPQNGDRIVPTDSATSLHLMYTLAHRSDIAVTKYHSCDGM